MKRKLWVAAWAAMMAAGLAAPPARAQQDKPVRIVVLEDLSGMYMGNGGPNMVLATRMAVEDFGGKVLGRAVEVSALNHQNKPDLGSSLAGQAIDQGGATAFVLGGSSAAGLAATAIAKQKAITTMVTGGYAANFVREQCSPYGTQWAPSTDALARTAAKGLVETGGKKWFLITADYAFGKALSTDVGEALKTAGGQVVGEAKHPLDSPDMASQLLQAQSANADVIALANAGPDLVTTIKQAREFGIGSKLAALLVFTNNVVAMGLDVTQGMRFPVASYWDLNDDTRAFGKRMMERNKGEVPTMGHIMAYVSTTHYLQSVEKAGTTDAAAVAKAMRQIPIKGKILQNASIQPNGRVVMDMFLVEVKKPAESRDPKSDLYKVLETLPGRDLFTPADKSGCPNLVSQ